MLGGSGGSEGDCNQAGDQDGHAELLQAWQDTGSPDEDAQQEQPNRPREHLDVQREKQRQLAKILMPDFQEAPTGVDAIRV